MPELLQPFGLVEHRPEVVGNFRRLARGGRAHLSDKSQQRAGEISLQQPIERRVLRRHHGVLEIGVARNTESPSLIDPILGVVIAVALLARRRSTSRSELDDTSSWRTADEVRHVTASDVAALPGRHGIGHNLFSYHRSPNGLITELFAELDQMKDESLGYFEPRPWHRDNPQRPKTWPKTPEAANLWGPMPPDEMME